jgi:hypothetical protein
VKTVLRATVKLVLGETWQLPLGVAVAVLAAGALRLSTGGGGWWRHGGGLVLAALLALALGAAIAASTARSKPAEQAGTGPSEGREDPVNGPEIA